MGSLIRPFFTHRKRKVTAVKLNCVGITSASSEVAGGMVMSSRDQ